MKKHVAIVVGGGPAPGINGVIASATIEAINRGYRVFGIVNGFEKVLSGDLSCVKELTISDVSRIHNEGGSILGASRANPMQAPEMMKNVVNALKQLNIGYLVTIGGDGTASSSNALAKALKGEIGVGHVPKTIDNDLPLPNKNSTFGFQSAREAGAAIVETLMVDSKTMSRWYFVIAMGRKAGHLALGIGISARATLTLIPEEFGDKKIPLKLIADIIVGSILKRMANKQPYGVVVLAEGLAEVLDVETAPELHNAERDPYGRIRFADVDFGAIIKIAVRNRLAFFGIKNILTLDKNVGYELRCRQPNAFDREYVQQLGYGVIDFLTNGGTGAMISLQADKLLPIPFEEMINPETGRARVRMVDLNSVAYQVAKKYMLRLGILDLSDNKLMQEMSRITSCSVEVLRNEFAEVARDYGA